MGTTRSASKAQLWSTRIAVFEASAQSRRVWCSAQAVNVHTLDYWRWQLRGRVPSKPAGGRAQAPDQPRSARATLVPVRVRGAAAAPSASSTAIELEWPNGLRLRTALGADVPALSALVRALWPC